MIKNSQSRLLKRRKGALERRRNDLKVWEGKLGGDAENKEFQAKVEAAKTDITNLGKKVPAFA